LARDRDPFLDWGTKVPDAKDRCSPLDSLEIQTKSISYPTRSAKLIFICGDSAKARQSRRASEELQRRSMLSKMAVVWGIRIYVLS
jgi:hypothetical protein